MRFNPFSRNALLIFAITGLLILAMWIAIASALSRSERVALERAEIQGRNIASSIADHMAASVRAIDLVSMHMRDDWVAAVVPFADQVAAHQASLGPEGAVQIIVTDANGHIAYSSLPGFAGIDVSDKPYFRGHDGRDRQELQIGAPSIELSLNELTIPFSRAIVDRQARFAGVMVLMIPPPILERVYKGVNLGDGATISLVRADGKILARSHDLSRMSDVSLTNIPGLGAGAAPAGGHRSRARTDGVERMYRYQQITGYPLTIYVGQALDTVLAPYRAQRANYLSVGAVATLSLLAMSLLFALRVHDKEETLRNRKQLEADLRERIAHLQLVYDTSSAAIFDVDRNGVITHANRRMAEMFGCAPEQLIGSAYVDCVHPDQRELGMNGMFALIEGRTDVLDRERLYRRRDGGDFWGRITGRRMLGADGKTVGLVGVIVDISDTKLAENALQRNEAHLRELFDAFPIAVAHIDKAQRMTFANRFYRESYGEIYQGLTVREFVGEKVYAVLAPIIKRALAGEVVVYEHSFTGEDGKVSTRALRYIPDRDAAGVVTGFFALREDITARRRAEEQLRHLNEDLERRVHERTTELSAANAALQAEVSERRHAEQSALDLAGRLQHMARRLGHAQEAERRRLAAELHDGVGSNLAAIGLNLALLQKQLPQGNIANMQRQLAELIELIDVAKASAKEISVDLRPLLLENRDLLPALEEYARKFETGTGITVRVSGGHSGGRLPAEKKIALFRIAQEALTNCAKHAQAKAVAIEFNSDADSLRLSVADDGVGMNFADIGAAKSGLGLLSMQERAESIGGRWEIESAPGKGTRVYVSVGAG
ncbi:MAG: PAS domain S-box protein [Burkholderiales bacterium]|nr:PAS domain S-box protein [Burkholderiales bacterium]